MKITEALSNVYNAMGGEDEFPGEIYKEGRGKK